MPNQESPKILKFNLILFIWTLGIKIALSACIENLTSCLTCLDGRTCLECATGQYVTSEGVCRICPGHCSSCINSQTPICTSCVSGWYITGDTCWWCYDDKCKTCDPSNSYICTECHIGESLIDGDCVPCPISNCLTCDSNNSCPACNSNNTVSFTSFASECLKCEDPNCNSCPNSLNLCTSCTQGYGVGILNECYPCSKQYCKICSTNKLLCDDCQLGYGKLGADCVSCAVFNCASCKANYLVCEFCISGFGLSSGVCVSCSNSSFCLECSADSSKCEKCVDTFGPSSIGNCETCTDIFCFSCPFNSTFCSVCGNTTHKLMINNGWSGKCPKCGHNYCVECNDDYFNCTACSTLFSSHFGLFYKAGTMIACEKCLHENCTNCLLNSSICVECINGMGPDENGTCIYCEEDYCLNCTTNSAICERCEVGYSASNGSCFPCDDSLCTSCPTSTNICINCTSKYGVDNGSCFPCQVGNCESCYDDYFQCTKCVTNFGLYDFITCVPCDVKCEDCSDNFQVCLQCKSGFALLSNGDCTPCQMPCVECDNSNPTLCTSCNEPLFFLSNGQCMQCSDNCLSCENETTCFECNESYYLFTDGYCLECPIECLKCELDLGRNEPSCSVCALGYERQSNGSFYYCEEICGDGIVINNSCDNKRFIPFDGCDNNCEIMEDFICQTVASKSICSYNKTIQMSKISFTSTIVANEFSLTLKLSPALHVFSVSSNEQLRQAFFLLDPEFSLLSISYDNKTSSVKLSIKLMSTFERSKIRVLFSPNEYLLSEYFSTPETEAELILVSPITYFSAESVFIAQILFYVCCVISVLLWIGFVLGIILKRLEGLEAMFVIQFCWINFLYTDTIFTFPFNSFLPIKFSVWYHVEQFVNSNSSVLDSPQFLSSIEIKPEFSNNFDISFLLFLVLSVFAIISFLVYYPTKNKKLSSSPILKEESNDNENSSDKKKLKIHEFSIQILFQLVLSSLCDFLFCSVIFVKSENRNDPISLILLCLSAIIIILVIITFYFDPDPFSYFRYSFNAKAISMNHYFIHIFIILLSLSFILLLPSFSYLAAIPLLIMIIFTLITKPYKETMSNYRSALNYCVMMSFVGFKLYLEEMEVKGKNALVFYMIEIVLLFVTVLFGIILQIFYEIKNAKNREKEKLEENNEINFILHNLVNTDVTMKMKKIDNNNCFKDSVPSKLSLHSFSNNLCLKRKKKNSLKDQLHNEKEEGTDRRIAYEYENTIWYRNDFDMDEPNELTKDDYKNYSKTEKEIETKTNLVEKVLTNESCYVQYEAAKTKKEELLMEVCEETKSEQKHYVEEYEMI